MHGAILCLQKRYVILVLAEFPECEPPKSNAKVRIVECIDERIDCTADPAEPS